MNKKLVFSILPLPLLAESSVPPVTYQLQTMLAKMPYYANIDAVAEEAEIKGEIPTDHAVEVMEHGQIEDGLYVNLEGYVKMNTSDSYLVFLRNTGENTYAITGSHQGKFNIKSLKQQNLLLQIRSPIRN